ncbi:MAG TPA: hypothetical protein VGF39_01490 [Stellaceae bacterium]
MTRISLVLWVGITAVLGLVCSGDVARAAELKVLASVALTSALNELNPVMGMRRGTSYPSGTVWPPI